MMKLFSAIVLLACQGVLFSVNANEIVMRLFQQSRDRMNAARTKALPPSFRGGRIPCSGGSVTVNGEEYPCSGIDFLSFVSADELMIPGQQLNLQSSDIWGWFDEVTEREITILTLDTGVVFLDSTDPEDPCILSKHRSARRASNWGDIKVIGNYAYAIKDRNIFDNQRDTGMEVYDLTKLRSMNCKVPNYVIPDLPADFVDTAHGACHNVVSNTETNRVYSVGCPNTCDGGLVIFDVSEDPLRPKQIGCADGDGYTHDAQCVLYSGPDTKYFGHEICIAFNEDTFTIWDVTFADDPVLVAREFYYNSGYSHQGWFNYEMTKVMLDDELDEICNFKGPTAFECMFAVSGSNGETRTTTYVWNVKDLENPILEPSFIHRQDSVDHNLYVWGAIHERGWGGNKPLSRIPDPSIAYLNNYMAGLILLDISSDNPAEWTEIAQFQITENTLLEFEGAWSGYLHPSGVYAISSIEKGLFFLDPKVEFVDANPIPVFTEITREGEGEENEADEEETGSSGASTGLVGVLSAFLIFSVLANVVVGVVMYNKRNSNVNAANEGPINLTTL